MPILEKQPWITSVEQPVSILAGPVKLQGELIVPDEAFGLVLFAAGGGLSAHGAVSRLVVRGLEEEGLAVLRFPLLAPGEDEGDFSAGRNDLPSLAGRLLGVEEWAKSQPSLLDFPIGVFASGVAAAALIAAAEGLPSLAALVCYDGRMDLAGGASARVQAPALLLVGADDEHLVRANERALLRLGSLRKELILIPGASSRFDGSPVAESVADLAAEWFGAHLIERS